MIGWRGRSRTVGPRVRAVIGRFPPSRASSCPSLAQRLGYPQALPAGFHGRNNQFSADVRRLGTPHQIAPKQQQHKNRDEDREHLENELAVAGSGPVLRWAIGGSGAVSAAGRFSRTPWFPTLLPQRFRVTRGSLGNLHTLVMGRVATKPFASHLESSDGRGVTSGSESSRRSTSGVGEVDGPAAAPASAAGGRPTRGSRGGGTCGWTCGWVWAASIRATFDLAVADSALERSLVADDVPLSGSR